MNFSRIDRVQELLKEEIARAIDRDLDNPLLPPFITIFGVKVSKDLHYATVMTTFLADATQEEIKRTVEELNRSAGYIGRLVAQRVRLRQHPQLRFVYTPSTRHALEMEKIFQKLHEEGQLETSGQEGDASGPSETGEAGESKKFKADDEAQAQ
jgi:ribosome-binding factor A